MTVLIRGADRVRVVRDALVGIVLDVALGEAIGAILRCASRFAAERLDAIGSAARAGPVRRPPVRPSLGLAGSSADGSSWWVVIVLTAIATGSAWDAARSGLALNGATP